MDRKMSLLKNGNLTKSKQVTIWKEIKSYIYMFLRAQETKKV